MPSNCSSASSIPQDSSQSSVLRSAPRKIRQIVTPSGRGVRGIFPSRKACKPAQFESRNEEMALRVLEVATQVRAIATQPKVFEFDDGVRRRRYTPDAALVTVGTESGESFIEVKDDRALAPGSDTVLRLRAVIRHLRQQGVPLYLILRSDLLSGDLQSELEVLLRLRPSRGRFRSDIEPSLWDPENHTEPDSAILQRWEAAKQRCDQLLERVMRRDPDDFLSISAR